MGVLQDKVIALTGASRGLGEAMAVGFAAEGASLVLGARTESDLDRVARRCEQAGAGAVRVVPTDVTREPDVDRLAQSAVDAYGRLDAFVADAGVSPMSLSQRRFTGLASYDLDVVEQMFQVNTIGMWLCLKAALPRMSSGGSFVAIGSGAPGSARTGMLAVTKNCVDVLATIAAAECADKGLRVNVLGPGGMVDTHLFGPDKMSDHLKSLPMGYSEPSVMVPAAVWLVSDDSSGVNGAQLTAKEFNAVGPDGIRTRLAAAGAPEPG
jgi:NAD(P)-dependent dehydrogenase (short-subunit alcohol dehydrogenase family)